MQRKRVWPCALAPTLTDEYLSRMRELSTPPIPDDQVSVDAEFERVAAVESLDLFGGDLQPAYDEAVYLASLICGTPIGLVTVLDQNTQRFKAKIGTDLTGTLKEESFCIHAIQQRELFVVPDTLLDSRFRELPLVSQAPHLRFYAGIPTFTPEGAAVGTLCVADTVPRELTEEQKASLVMIGRQVSSLFRERRRILRLNEILAEKERIEIELRNSTTLFQSFMDNSPLIGFMKNASGRMAYYNRAFASHFEITREAWIGRNEYEFFPADVAKRLAEADHAILQSDELAVMETSIPGPSGAEHDWRTYKFAFVNAEGERFLAGLCHEITTEKNAARELERYHAELRLANERLFELSSTDPLTGCLNRRSLDEELENQFACFDRRYGFVSVLLIDIDDFKKINDTFGHEVGDQVLCHVATLLQKGARREDFVYRYGGEEFAILLPHTSKENAILLADRHRRSVEQVWSGCAVTVSIGVASRSLHVSTSSAVLRQADTALYRAKAQGKNCVVSAIG